MFVLLCCDPFGADAFLLISQGNSASVLFLILSGVCLGFFCASQTKHVLLTWSKNLNFDLLQ